MKAFVKSAMLTGLILFASLSVIYAQNKGVLQNEARSEYIEVAKNVKLHITDQGSGKTIVLIHGWPLSDAMYEYQYQELIQKGFRVIGISLRGFGKSDKPYGDYNYDVYAKDIDAVLNKLDLHHVTLGGYSMGGAISIHYTAVYNKGRVTKLALFGAAGPSWTQKPGYPYGFSNEEVNDLIQLSRTDRPKLLQNFGEIFGATKTSINPGLGNWLGGINLEASPYATTQSLIALRDADLRPDLAKINIPTAIFHGVQDKICSFSLAEQMHLGIKNSYIVRFEQSGHGLFVEEREKFNQELITFANK